MNSSEIYMHRCIQLARLGERRVAPNPMVGCVVVHHDRIIGEGFHQKYGEAHAEVNAICSVVDQTLLKQSVLYVNLEPCAHYGKTPPCADLIVDCGIPKVVIGTVDPYAEVAGKGIEKLRKNGVEVEVDVLSEQCLELNRRFFVFHREKRPYIFLKWAQTADGFVDIDRTKPAFGQPTWITNEMARIAVHKQRASESAIFIGTETALKDNPSLTLRDWYGEQPLRVVPDRKQRLPANLNLFDKQAPSVLLTPQPYPDRQDIAIIPTGSDDDAIDKMLTYLFENGILSVIVEGGPRMLQSFIERKLWDEAHVYIGQITFKAGIKAPVFNYSPVMFDRFYNSELRIFRNR